MSDATPALPLPCDWPSCPESAGYVVQDPEGGPWHACEDHATTAAFTDSTVTAVDL